MDDFVTFTAGPVEMSERTRQLGAQKLPYFRTADFSKQMLAAEEAFLRLAGAPDASRAVFLTGSGTAAMEAAVMNVFAPGDRALIVNGGGFGQRFCEMCDFHGVPYDAIALDTGEPLTTDALAAFDPARYTAFLVNLHETSTGTLFDIGLIGDYCRRHGLLLIVDAISAFIADPFNMAADGVDVLITSSQKALAAAPGVSLMAMSPRALERIEANPPKSYYLDLRRALADGARGQTPFTPAEGVLIQLFFRLRELSGGGMERERAHMRELALDFRARLQGLPLRVATKSPSNAVTPLYTREGVSAHGVFETLMNEYRVYVCPNGGALRSRLFRVGHMGALTLDDNTRLLDALRDMERRGLL